MGFGSGGPHYYIPPPIPRSYGLLNEPDPSRTEGYVVKERALDGTLGQVYSSDPESTRNYVRHDQVFSTDGKENFGFF